MEQSSDSSLCSSIPKLYFHLQDLSVKWTFQAYMNTFLASWSIDVIEGRKKDHLWGFFFIVYLGYAVEHNSMT